MRTGWTSRTLRLTSQWGHCCESEVKRRLGFNKAGSCKMLIAVLPWTDHVERARVREGNPTPFLRIEAYAEHSGCNRVSITVRRFTVVCFTSLYPSCFLMVALTLIFVPTAMSTEPEAHQTTTFSCSSMYLHIVLVPKELSNGAVLASVRVISVRLPISPTYWLTTCSLLVMTSRSWARI